MTQVPMTSMQRVLTSLQHKEPDRVPLFLLPTMHGALELGLSIPEYFSKAEYVAEGQLRMRTKFRNDCLYGLFYAAVEVEAFGAEVLFRDDGPAVAGQPFLRPEDIHALQAPRVRDCACLQKVLKALALMKAKVGNEAPIIGVVMSPFSLPVMQLGFERYLELIYEQPTRFETLMKVNETFCAEWANAQLDAGATAICYFDPVSSPTVVPPVKYMEVSHPIAVRTLAQIKGPTATHFASGRCLPILDKVAQTGTAIVGVSADEDLSNLKDACRGKLSLLGNLNGIAMRNWSQLQAETIVKEAITKAGPGGGFILSDNHGEIPWQVPTDVLLTISEAVHRWGHYPLQETE